MTTQRHRTAIIPQEWSTASLEKLTFRGPNALAIAGRHAMVQLELAAMPPEERYALARTLGRWCERAERQALADIEAEAQAPLF